MRPATIYEAQCARCLRGPVLELRLGQRCFANSQGARGCVTQQVAARQVAAYGYGQGTSYLTSLAAAYIMGVASRNEPIRGRASTRARTVLRASFSRTEHVPSPASGIWGDDRRGNEEPGGRAR